jgi:hypothetical protein
MMLFWPKTLSNKMIVISAAKKVYLCDTNLEQFSIFLEFENQICAADWGQKNENMLAIAFVISCFIFFKIIKKNIRFC